MTQTNDHELRCLIDWLSVTLKTTDLLIVYNILGIEESEFVKMPTSVHGYKHRIACGNIWVLYEGTPDMGIHIQFNGQGCREYETYHNGDWIQLLSTLYRMQSNFSRIDLAVDDIRYNNDKPYWTLQQLIRKVKRAHTRTKFRKGIREEGIYFATGESTGQTLYCGSPSSMLRLVFYEKNFERIAAGETLEENLTTWNRMEFHLRKDRAESAVEWIVNGASVGELIFGIVGNYINFLDPNPHDSNKARWQVSQFWLDFLNDAYVLKLAKSAPDKTIARKKIWIDNQVLPTLAELWIAFGNPGEDYFVDMINEGLERMTDAQWERAEEFRAYVLQQQAEEKDNKESRIERYLQKRAKDIIEFRKTKKNPSEEDSNTSLEPAFQLEPYN